MNTEEFRLKAQCTYVWVKAELCGVVIPRSKTSENSYMSNRLNYEGYVEIPYDNETFSKFTETQKFAICQATMVKFGLCYSIIEIDCDSFYR